MLQNPNLQHGNFLDSRIQKPFIYSILIHALFPCFILPKGVGETQLGSSKNATQKNAKENSYKRKYTQRKRKLHINYFRSSPRWTLVCWRRLLKNILFLLWGNLFIIQHSAYFGQSFALIFHKKNDGKLTKVWSGEKSGLKFGIFKKFEKSSQENYCMIL